VSAAYGIISAISASNLLDIFIPDREGSFLVHLVKRERRVASFPQITMIRGSALHEDGNFLAWRERPNRSANLYRRGTKRRSALLTLGNARAKKQAGRNCSAQTRRPQHGANGNMHDGTGAREGYVFPSVGVTFPWPAASILPCTWSKDILGSTWRKTPLTTWSIRAKGGKIQTRTRYMPRLPKRARSRGQNVVRPTPRPMQPPKRLA
jgi:hypothetical protein